jgi:hypothetical protein
MNKNLIILHVSALVATLSFPTSCASGHQQCRVVVSYAMTARANRWVSRISKQCSRQWLHLFKFYGRHRTGDGNEDKVTRRPWRVLVTAAPINRTSTQWLNKQQFAG